jgi:hypothetical protein
MICERLVPVAERGKAITLFAGYGQPGTPQGQIAGLLSVSAQQLIPQLEHLPTGSNFLKSSFFICQPHSA